MPVIAKPCGISKLTDWSRLTNFIQRGTKRFIWTQRIQEKRHGSKVLGQIIVFVVTGGRHPIIFVWVLGEISDPSVEFGNFGCYGFLRSS